MSGFKKKVDKHFFFLLALKVLYGRDVTHCVLYNLHLMQLRSNNQ